MAKFLHFYHYIHLNISRMESALYMCLGCVYHCMIMTMKTLIYKSKFLIYSAIIHSTVNRTNHTTHKYRRCGMIANETVIHQIPSNNNLTSACHPMVLNDGENSYCKTNCKSHKTKQMKCNY